MSSSTATLSMHPSSEMELRAEVARLRIQNRRLQGTVDRLVSEIDAAAILQRQLASPTSLKLNGASIDVYCRPAGEVSGDIYHTVRLTETTTAIIVIDVTGHGLAAGILGAVLNQRLLDYINGIPQPDKVDPGDLLSQLNASLITSQLPDCQFATATVAIFDESSGMLRIARAGAPYPILVQARESAATPLKSEGALIGVLPHARFETVEVYLRLGDAVFFWTDGLEHLMEESELHAMCETTACAREPSDPQRIAPLRLFEAITLRTDNAIDLGRELDDTTVVVLERTVARPSEQQSPEQGPECQVLQSLS